MRHCGAALRRSSPCESTGGACPHRPERQDRLTPPQQGHAVRSPPAQAPTSAWRACHDRGRDERVPTPAGGGRRPAAPPGIPARRGAHRAAPHGIPARRRAQRPPLGGARAGGIRLLAAGHRDGPDEVHGPGAAARRPRRGAVLVGVRPEQPPRRHRRHGDARAGRRSAPARGRLPPPPGARPDRRRGRGRLRVGPGRVPDGRGGRPVDRLLPGCAPDAPRAGGSVHDADPQRQHAVGRLGHGRRGPPRAVALRCRGGPGDEPGRDDGRPLTCVVRHDACRTRRRRGPGDLQPLLGAGG